MIQFEKKSASHLVRAYNLMICSMRDAFDDQQHTTMSLQRALDNARHEVVDSGAITAEEAHELAEFIKMDVNDAAEIMMESSAEFYDWLALDIDVIERKVLEMFLGVADKTRGIVSDLHDNMHVVADATIYPVGKIAGPAKLVCIRCGHGKPLISTSIVTACESCGHRLFTETSGEQKREKSSGNES